MNKRIIKHAIDTIEKINERILSAYEELNLGGGDSEQQKKTVWYTSPRQMFETIEAALEMLDEAITHADMIRNYLEEESCEGVDIDRDFDDNEPNLCDKCQRTMNRKENRPRCPWRQR